MKMGILSPIVLLAVICSVHYVSQAQAKSSAKSDGSDSELLGLLLQEKRLHEHVSEYSKALDARKAVIDGFLNNFKEHVTNAGLNLDSLADSDDPFEYVKAFPVLKYLTLRRLTNDLDNLIDEMNGDLGESQLLERIEAAKDEGKWPTAADKDKSISRILEAHNTYDFDVQAFAEGKLFGTEIGLSLNPAQCAEIGKLASKQRKYASAVEWTNIAIRRGFQVEIGDPNVGMIEIGGSLLSANAKHNEILEKHLASNSGREVSSEVLWNLDLFHKNIRLLSSFTRQRIRHAHPEIKYSELSEASRFQKLCSDNYVPVERVRANTNCWYESRLHPYLILNPLRIEILNEKPRLVKIHNFIGTTTAGVLRKLSALKSSKEQMIDTRALHAAVGKDELDQAPRYLGSVEVIMAKLAGKLFEGIHSHTYVSRYSLGGFGEDHLTSLMKEKRNGPRSTLFVDVSGELSGTGAVLTFPELGVATEMTRGSAVVLYEDNNSSRRRVRLCPIFSGRKWIAASTVNGTPSALLLGQKRRK